MIVPVILSGGSGTRLWPLSRKAYPKQFLPLVNDESLFQTTVQRLAGIQNCHDPLIVCNEEHRFLVAEQLRQVNISQAAILLEPIGRNTAPAVACAAIIALETDPDAVLLVMPSDHIVADTSEYKRKVEIGREHAEQGELVTFGIVPTGPETGYGYIRKRNQETGQAYPVAEFVEKPDLDTATQYFESGDYYWNSGMFMFRADRYLQELEVFVPEILQACRDACAARKHDLDFTRLDKAAFTACPSDSIDYAVMEKTTHAAVIPLDAGWNDVGSWSSLWEVQQQDDAGNVAIGDVLSSDVTNCYLRAEHKLVSAIGLKDTVVIETADAVLVADRSRMQDVKLIVDRLQQDARCEHNEHVRVYRPWGSYETVDECARFKVKRITVNPGASLSLQMHHHRSEHWVVVKGTARVQRDEEIITLKEDESVYIPIGAKHRLENPGVIPIELIEVQTGSYLGEDDIVRFSDVYGRHDQ